jgi:DNA-binding NtrC family response regulator
MATVLVAEHDEQVRILAQGIIQDLGHEVLTAGNLKESTALLDDKRLSLDLLFTELDLSDGPQAGITVARYARLGHPNIRLMYTTGAGVNDGTRALFLEPYVFLAKPYTTEQLQLAIGNVLTQN